MKLEYSSAYEEAGDDETGLDRNRETGGPGGAGLRREANDNMAVSSSGDVSKRLL